MRVVTRVFIFFLFTSPLIYATQEFKRNLESLLVEIEFAEKLHQELETLEKETPNKNFHLNKKLTRILIEELKLEHKEWETSGRKLNNESYRFTLFKFIFKGTKHSRELASAVFCSFRSLEPLKRLAFSANEAIREASIEMLSHFSTTARSLLSESRKYGTLPKGFYSSPPHTTSRNSSPWISRKTRKTRKKLR